MPKILNPELIEAHAQKLYGCSNSQAVELNGGLPTRTPRSPAMRYQDQRIAAGRRGISWEITFPEWMSIWHESGRWADRGVGVGRYCMARHGDIGPYSAANVSIQLCTDNSRDGIEKARPAILANPALKAGRGRGWTYRPHAAKPYQVVACHKYIGTFLTQGEAEAAYQNAVSMHGIGAR